MKNWNIAAAALLIGISVFSVWQCFYGNINWRKQVDGNFPKRGDRKPRKHQTAVWMQHFVPSYYIEYLDSQINRSGGLFSIGPIEILSADQFIAIQSLCVTIIFALSMLYEFCGPKRLWAPFVIAGLSGYVPIYCLNKMIRRRQIRILTELPGVLEILALSVEAGLGFDAAMGQIIKQKKGLITDALVKAKTAIDAGMTREEAYTKIAAAGSQELRVFIRTILKAEQQGHPIRQTISELAIAYRRKQSIEIEAMANRLPTTMLLPIFIFIVPPIILVYLLPALINLQVIFM